MYGYGFHNNKLKIHPGENPGFFLPGVMGAFPGVAGQGNRNTGQQGNRDGIYSRALRKLQRKPCKNTYKNGNFTQNTKIFA